MKRFTTTFAALVLCLVAFGQDWAPLESTEKFTVYFAKADFRSQADGMDHERIIFRYENHTSEALVLTFNRTLAYTPDGAPIQQEQQFRVALPPNGSVEYSNDSSYDKTYYIFSKDHKGTIKRALMDFKLTNLQVN